MSLPPSTDLSEIKKFPSFSKYNPLMKGRIQELTTNLLPYADFSTQVMEIWFNANNDLELSVVSENLLFKFSDLLDDNMLKYYFAGTHNIDESVEEIRNSGKITKLFCLPQETIDLIHHKDNLLIEEDRDNFEYLLSVKEQVELSGSKFGKYRRKVNGIMTQLETRLNSQFFDLSIDTNRKHLLELYASWETRNDPEGSESRAIKHALNNFKELQYQSVVITIDGEIHAFTVYFMHKDGKTANISHTKSSYKYDNLFDYAVHATAKHLQNQGVECMNFEMDLGIPGLRMHKMGLRPYSFLKKYSLIFV